MKSQIEKMILDQSFDYLQPYFYNNPYALRCELGIGETEEEYLANAKSRAEKIYKILFPHAAQAIIFDYWKHDWADSDDAWGDRVFVENIVSSEAQQTRFLLENLQKYRHVTVKNLKTYCEPDDPDYDSIRHDRVVCYSDGKGFDDIALLYGQIEDSTICDVSLVSFENECILSVYDDRGCDVVFANHKKMSEFFELLRPYLFDYDMEEMEKRLNGGQKK
ncbi:MAG: DUF3885 domain-containing protein [Clostridia bacterium]|nr:DUF3885 domain-containing protein [Clostridia bacterium]